MKSKKSKNIEMSRVDWDQMRMLYFNKYPEKKVYGTEYEDTCED